MPNLTFKRNISPYLVDLMKKYPIIGIVDASQTGKTTLSQSMAPEFQYMNLENPK